MEFGSQLLTVAVMAILITAPLGAVMIMVTGPRLLAREVPAAAEEVEGAVDPSPASLARFREAQHHGSQQIIAARRFSCL